MFVKTKNTNGDDSVAYYHHDQLGTPIQATDKTGNVVWSADYNVFGRATITTPAASVDKPTVTSRLRLPGQIVDEETGLHYNWHRYYDSEIGRYVTEDPIGFVGGYPNLYLYSTSDPINHYDPKGLSSQATNSKNKSMNYEDIWNQISSFLDNAKSAIPAFFNSGGTISKFISYLGEPAIGSGLSATTIPLGVVINTGIQALNPDTAKGIQQINQQSQEHNWKRGAGLIMDQSRRKQLQDALDCP